MRHYLNIVDCCHIIDFMWSKWESNPRSIRVYIAATTSSVRHTLFDHLPSFRLSTIARPNNLVLGMLRY